MKQIELMKKQHKEIAAIIDKLKSALPKEDYAVIAKIINELAGKIIMHLKYEDDYLYPELLKNESTIVKDKANKFIKEMGDLASVFVEYKDKYNTKSKIESNLNEFKKSSTQIIRALEKRLNKEDNELYVYVK